MDLGYRNIILNSQLKELPQLCRTDQQVNTICQDESLWREIYAREGVEFPDFPSKSEFYLNKLLIEKFGFREAQRWVDLLYFQGNTIGEAQRWIDLLSFQGNVTGEAEIFVLGIDQLPEDVFDDIHINREEWIQFRNDAIEAANEETSFGERHKLMIYYNEGFIWVSLDDPEWSYDILGFENRELRILISRLLQHGLKFYSSDGVEINLPPVNDD